MDIHIHEVPNQERIIYVMQRKYGLGKFFFDCVMVILTAGFWLIWIFIREMRKR